MVSTIRFSGIASGMDTQSIVDSLMQAQRIPLDKLNQKRQVIEWQRDSYREMNKLLDDFSNFIFDGIYRQANMLTRSAVSSNSDVVTAKAAPNAGTISYKLENVTIATAARMQSTAAVSKDGKIDSTKSLWSQRDKLEGFTWKQEEVTNNFKVPEKGATDFQLTKGAVSETLNLNANGKLEVKNADGEVQEFDVVVGSIPETKDANTVYIDENTGKMSFGTKLEGDSSFSVSYNHNYLEFNIETYKEDGSTNKRDSDFKIAGNVTLDSMLSQINSSNVGVNMFYDSHTDQMVVQRKDTGNLINSEGKSINFTGASADFFTQALKLTEEQAGSNAKFTINGLETERASNTFTMSGVTFTLHNNSVAGESTSVTVGTDTDAIMTTIKDFVNKYNELLDKVNGKLTEEKYSSFTPLTQEQKLAMSEKEIEQWEEKAKSGLLRRDQILDSAMTTLRNNLYSEVKSNEVTLTDPKFNQLAEIGITTTKDYMARGKLEINEDKLKAAIEENPEAIFQLFMADGPTYEEQGLARRVRDTLSNTVKKIEERAGNAFRAESNYTLGKQLGRVKDDISRLEDRLKMVENRYWSQFNAMEKAMQNLNNQSNMLLSYLGMGAQQQ
ncbi:hypothetical protein CHH80_14780 [Bacillus sp. 7504-2]|nr:hypothetical protein CHH80_14780 [Bacillus sp. 7504-2]